MSSIFKKIILTLSIFILFSNIASAELNPCVIEDDWRQCLKEQKEQEESKENNKNLLILLCVLVIGGLIYAKDKSTFKGNKDLNNDEYKIFLTKKYKIQFNDALGKFIVKDKLFDAIADALIYADELEKSKNVKPKSDFDFSSK